MNECFKESLLESECRGHNCGYRQPDYSTWMHAYFPSRDGRATTIEALFYTIPLV